MKHLRILLISALLVLAGTCMAFAADFIDVPAGAWYYTYVNELSDQGMVSGRGGGLFCPQDFVTKTEALKLVLQAADIEVEHLSTDEELAAFWGADILATAAKNGVAQVSANNKNSLATREEICSYIVNAKGWQNASHLDGIFEDSDSDNGEILYAKGIVSGSKGTKGYDFLGGSNVTRAETSTLIYRLYHYDPLELRPVIGDAEACLVSNPETIEDWQKVMMYMSKNNLTTLTVKYEGDAIKLAREKGQLICDNACAALGNSNDAGNNKSLFAVYPEFLGFTPACDVQTSSAGTFFVTLELKERSLSDAETQKMRTVFFDEATKATNALINNGSITKNMTDREKASVVFDYVCKVCEYDKSASNKNRYTGYGAAIDHLAVCQGYTSMYNTMLRLLGIPCRGVVGNSVDSRVANDHIWTYANIDGQWLHIDVTFGDTSASEAELGNYDYFCKTDSEFKRTHTWKM